jgi:tetratricopeptide (TPR) repeat protein
MKHYDDIEADDCYDMAVEWVRHGNAEKAVNFLIRAIDLNQNFTYAYIALARIFATQKKFTDAVQILKKASRIDPAFDRLQFLMAKYTYKNGDYKNAMICINRAIEIDEKELYILAREIIEDMYHRRHI